MLAHNRFPIGVQCFPFDVVDEGAREVVTQSRQRLGASVLLPAVTYVPERHPYPAGELPHNPVRQVYQTDGGIYFRPDLDLYAASGIKPCLTGEPGIVDRGWLAELAREAAAQGMDVYGWVSILNGKAAAANREASVVDVLGRVVPGWLCPNHPEVRKYAAALMRDVVRHLPLDGVFVDRIRFPEWGGRGMGVGAALTCFCEHCIRRAARLGIQLESVRDTLRENLATLAGGAAAEGWAAGVPRHLNAIDLLKRGEALNAVATLCRVRQVAIRDLVSLLRKAARAERPDLPFWLDLWPPSYGWVLGQDFAQLKPFAEAVKIFTYHKLGGGIDIAAVLDEFRTSCPSVPLETLYGLFLDLFRFPAPSSFAGFQQAGFHTEFVTEETLRARAELGDVPLIAGLQIWNVSESEVEEAVRAALKAKPHGIIYYNYGWAPFANMERARRTVEELGA